MNSFASPGALPMDIHVLEIRQGPPLWRGRQ